MDITWYEYQTTELHDGKTVFSYSEKYVLVSENGDELVFDYYRNGEKLKQVGGKKSYANGHIRNQDLKLKESTVIQTAFGEKEVEVYAAQRCGGSGATYTDSEGITYRSVSTQMWSGGVICEITRELTKYG